MTSGSPACRAWEEPGNVFGQGKNAALIALAHEIPYVATATIADLHDLEAKVERAMGKRVDVEEYLRTQRRYAHLFEPERREDVLARIQARADRNLQRFGLL